MQTRTTEAVCRDHLELRQKGDLDTDLTRNYDPVCVLLTSYGTFHGHAGVRDAAALLKRQIGHTHYNYKKLVWHEELAFMEWTVHNDDVAIADGADSYWIQDGRIRVMTIHYTVQPA